MAGREMKLVALLGDPVGHSLSPIMHNAAFRHEGLDMTYMAFRVAREDLNTALDGLSALGALGTNITVPHKEGAFRWVRRLDGSAAGSGAVNTILFHGGDPIGFNTDIYGVKRALQDLSPSPGQAMILGAGGAARGVLKALLEKGFREVFISNRTEEKSLELAREFREVSGGAVLSVVPWDEDPSCRPDLLVNATSLGLDSNPFDPLLMEKVMNWTSGGVLLDMVYDPQGETALVRSARKRGIRSIGGERVLLYQGVRAYEIFTGREAPVEIMRKAMAGSPFSGGEPH